MRAVAGSFLPQKEVRKVGKRDRTRIKNFWEGPAEQALSLACEEEKGEVAALHFPAFPYPHCVRAAVGALSFFCLFNTMIRAKQKEE